MEEINYTPVDLMKVYIPGDLVKVYGDVCQVISVKRRNGVIIDVQVVSPTEHITRCVDFDIVEPLPLTPVILEANGWKKEPSENVTWYKYRTDKSNLYICKDSFNNKDWLVCVGLDKHFIANVKYTYELQHFLFGLGLNSELKV